MDKKAYAIGVLAVTAVVLLVGNLMIPAPASAGFSVTDGDYHLIVARDTVGNDSVYVVDRNGRMAVFNWDASTKSLTHRASRAVSEMFGTR